MRVTCDTHPLLLLTPPVQVRPSVAPLLVDVVRGEIKVKLALMQVRGGGREGGDGGGWREGGGGGGGGRGGPPPPSPPQARVQKLRSTTGRQTITSFGDMFAASGGEQQHPKGWANAEKEKHSDMVKVGVTCDV